MWMLLDNQNCYFSVCILAFLRSFFCFSLITVNVIYSEGARFIRTCLFGLFFFYFTMMMQRSIDIFAAAAANFEDFSIFFSDSNSLDFGVQIMSGRAYLNLEIFIQKMRSKKVYIFNVYSRYFNCSLSYSNRNCISTV